MCEGGYHCPLKNGPKEKDCEAGFFCEKGKPKQTCPVGKLCQGANTITPESCTAGSYCENGLLKASCEPGYYCPKGSTTKYGNPIEPFADPGGDFTCQNGQQCVCPDKHYCPSFSDKPTLCPKTYYCPSKSAKPFECDAGKFCDAGTGEAKGVPCKEGYMCGKMAAKIDQFPCTSGYFCPAGTATEDTCTASNCPKPCPIGFYCSDKNINGQETKCTAGYYCEGGAKGQTVDELCKPGFYCEDGKTQTSCGQKHYCPVGSTASTGRPLQDSSGCKQKEPCLCKPGFLCKGGSQNGETDPCPAGSSCLNGEQKPCERGCYCEGQSSQQNGCPDSLCPQDHFCPPETAHKFQYPCEDEANKHLCTPGSKCDKSLFPFCDSEFRRALLDDLQEAPTPFLESRMEEYTIPVAKKTDLDCLQAEGYYCQSRSPVLCPKGWYCPSGSAGKLLCSAGYYCPDGSTASDGRPILADSGRCQVGSSCLCPAGRYCLEGQDTWIGSGPCKPGFYCLHGASERTGHGPCLGGHFCESGASSPNGHGLCHAGSYCPEASTTAAMFICPSGSYCEEGSEKPTSLCSPGHYCKPGAGSKRGHGQCLVDYDCTEAGATTPTGRGRLEKNKTVHLDAIPTTFVVDAIIQDLNSTEDTSESVVDKVVENDKKLANDVKKITYKRPRALESEQPSNASRRLHESSDRRLANLYNNSRFSFDADVGFEIGYLNDINELMTWGGVDIGISFDGVPIIDGITFKFGFDYWSCENNGNEELTPAGTNFGFSGISFSLNLHKALYELVTNGRQAFKDTLKNSFGNLPSEFSVSATLGFGTGLWRNDGKLDEDDPEGPKGSSTLALCQPWSAFRPTNMLPTCPVRRQLRSKGDTLPVDRRTETAARATSSSSLASDIAKQGINLLEKNELAVPFCIGKCEGDDVNLDQTISGEITIGLSNSCDGVTIEGVVDTDITLSRLALVALSGIDEDVAQAVSNALGPLGDMGLKPKASLSLTVGPGTTLELKAKGTPCLVCSSDASPPSDGLLKILNDVVSSVNFETRVKLEGLSAYEMELRVGLPPQTIAENFFWLRSKDKESGASFFAKLRVDSFRTTPTITQTVGLEIEATICLDECTSETPQYVYFSGKVLSETVTGTTAPPTARVGGSLTLQGEVREAFGIPFLHFTYLTMGATFSGKFPFPSSLLIGGSGCIGKESACFPAPDGTRTGTRIEADVFLGFDEANPSNNFYYAAFTDLTFETVLRILEENIHASFGSILELLPQDLKVSGIRPRLPLSDPKCQNLPKPKDLIESQVEDSKTQTRMLSVKEGIDPDCRAYIAVAPLGTPQIDDLGISIKRGISFGGQINILNIVVVDIDFEADIFSDSGISVKADATMKPIKLGSAIEITNYENTGGPRFKVDFSTTPPGVLIEISGRIALPIIESEIKTDIRVNDAGAILKGELELFGGVFPKTTVDIMWKWDGTLFDAKLGNFAFSFAFKINKLRIYTSNFDIAVSYF